MNQNILDQFETEKGTILSFRNVATKNEADDLSMILSQNGIISKVVKDSADLDAVYIGENPLNKFEILILEKDREKAEKVMFDLVSADLNEISPDHYLFSFTNEELLDVLIQKNEWNELDVLLSEKILKERGTVVDQKNLEQKREIRDLELAKPEGGQTGWIIFGYISAFLGGFFGLVIGYFIWQAKNKLPNGTKVYAYNDDVRRHGQIIFFLSLIIFPIVFLLKIAFRP